MFLIIPKEFLKNILDK